MDSSDKPEVTVEEGAIVSNTEGSVSAEPKENSEAKNADLPIQEAPTNNTDVTKEGQSVGRKVDNPEEQPSAENLINAEALRQGKEELQEERMNIAEPSGNTPERPAGERDVESDVKSSAASKKEITPEDKGEIPTEKQSDAMEVDSMNASASAAEEGDDSAAHSDVMDSEAASAPTIERKDGDVTEGAESAEQNEDKNAKEEDAIVAKVEETEEKPIPTRKSRRSSTRHPTPSLSRTLRPRAPVRPSTEKPAGTATPDENVTKPPVVTPGTAEPTKAPETSVLAQPASEPEPESLEDRLPKPMMEPTGLCMRVGDACFVTEDQLDELKLARLRDKKVKPFEHVTFDDLRTYNRDQLRAFCFAYGMQRRKKTEMEADMVRYLSYWNKGRPGFDVSTYRPANYRGSEGTALDYLRGPNPHIGLTPSTEGSLRHSSSRRTSAQNQAAIAAARAIIAKTGALGPSASAHRGLGVPPANMGHRAAIPSKGTKMNGNPVPILPRGLNTSFKQRIHAMHAGAKFKAAYDGAGPAIVSIVENAAAFFEGKDTPEVIFDQARSYERYQFNVDMLTEIFDGGVPVPDKDNTEKNDGKRDFNQKIIEEAKSEVLGKLAKRMVSGKRSAQEAELDQLEKMFVEMEQRTKRTERTNMRLFQRLERSETREQIEAVRKEFEKEYNVSLDLSSPPPLVRRKLDKSLPAITVADSDTHILRFKLT